MRILGPDDRTPPERPSAVTVGVFDGVHRGHLAVFEALARCAEAHDPALARVAITFAIHPKTITIGHAPPSITSFDHRLRLLERNGFDAVLVLPFDEALRSQTAAAFLHTWIKERLDARALVLGWDSKFGRDREGTFETVAPLAATLGIEVHAIPPFVLRGRPVSSTAIREAISIGDLAGAREMLGRSPGLLGRVVEGDRRGRTILFPTANLALEHEVTPPLGVYAVYANVGDAWLPAVMNLGRRPTVDQPDAPVTAEVHVLDWEGDLYGEMLEVHLEAFLREERRFDGLDALRSAIQGDVSRARDLLPPPR
ncbi:MAG: riboflavin biosynthesis protein RibF [Planctomycetes bacterium]|nr:riboflavin biosynthesis protein RibF [Planctomycetota bacterium]